MHDMSELERRLSAALDRISKHSAGLQRPAPTPEVVDAAPDDLPAASELKAELEAERAVTAQLEERVRAIKEKQDTRVAQLETDLESARNRVAALEEENEDLRDGAGSGGDSALQAELNTLRAEREAERAELADLLSQLQPIVEESASA